jgi:putative nucleotidyltransferase with HDIG domain
VGTLSEAAAEAIEANPLLARVGSYFHDVGKMLGGAGPGRGDHQQNSQS